MKSFDALKFLESTTGQWDIHNGVGEKFKWLVMNSGYPYHGEAQTLEEAVADFKTKNEEWMKKYKGTYFGNPVKPFKE